MTVLAIVLSLIAVGALLLNDRPRKAQNGTSARHSPCYFAVRVNGRGISQDIYWGPFATSSEATAWAMKHRVRVNVFQALHPDTPESLWIRPPESRADGAITAD